MNDPSWFASWYIGNFLKGIINEEMFIGKFLSAGILYFSGK